MQNVQQNRQSMAPVQFAPSVRSDNSNLTSSGRAGQVCVAGYIPVLRGDSLSGSFGIDLNMMDMPKPLHNGVIVNAQTWFVPKNAHPQYSGHDEFMASYHKEQITALNQPARDAPAFYTPKTIQAQIDLMYNSELYLQLGLHNALGDPVNSDLVDAYNLIWNFRAAAHSEHITRRQYLSESIVNSTKLAQAFWTKGKLAGIVPDYDERIIVGALDLDITAGQIPVGGISRTGANTSATDAFFRQDADFTVIQSSGSSQQLVFNIPESGATNIFAEMADQVVETSLAGIEKARSLQAFSKIRQSMHGHDTTGFHNDDIILAELMQGFHVPAEQFRRPMLLDSKIIPFGFAQRFSSSSGSLAESLSRGAASVEMRYNLPRQDTGGFIIFTFEVTPEQLWERQQDPYLNLTDPDELPNALRDVQRQLPVDNVLNKRLDTAHTDPNGLYGYERMNNTYNRNFTRMGGVYYQPDPLTPFNAARSVLWQSEIVDPTFDENHYLCPENFNHSVFTDTQGPAFEFVARHTAAIRGVTQIGDPIREDTNDIDAVEAEVG